MSSTVSKTISLKLEGRTLKIIERMAKKECRSVTQHVRKIVQDYAEASYHEAIKGCGAGGKSFDDDSKPEEVF